MTGSRKLCRACLSVIASRLGADATKDRPLLPGRIGEGAGDSAVEKCREPLRGDQCRSPISQTNLALDFDRRD